MAVEPDKTTAHLSEQISARLLHMMRPNNAAPFIEVRPGTKYNAPATQTKNCSDERFGAPVILYKMCSYDKQEQIVAQD